MILEGGSIEVNGAGALLTTEVCLLNPNRNPTLSRDEIEQRLRDYLGVREILWLGDGIEGDDTDGHIDDLTRFVSERTVVTVVEEDRSRSELRAASGKLGAASGHALEGPSRWRSSSSRCPRRMDREDLRLPASYANFYIANECVLLPTFNDPNDAAAEAGPKRILPSAMHRPDRLQRIDLGPRRLPLPDSAAAKDSLGSRNEKWVIPTQAEAPAEGHPATI